MYCSSGSKFTTNDDNFDNQESEDYKMFLDNVKDQLDIHDYNSDMWNLTDYVQDVSSYIAGFVVRALKRCITCNKCKTLLEGDEDSRLQVGSSIKS